MARSIDETRREFLLKLARTAAFVPPLVATVSVGEAAAQGKGKSGVPASPANVGGLSPTAAQLENPTFSLQQQQKSASPWKGQPSQPPPWSAPPPTQTGR